ncbi:hypothetical protein L9F63_026500, partial [Diploptera punctata]
HHLMVQSRTLDHRVGTDIDRDRLLEVFYSRGFTVFVEENLTHINILNSVKSVINLDITKNGSCFALCILSHGTE